MNLIDVSRELATDQQCLAFLESQRWPDGIVRCPTCGNSHISKITRKSKTKNLRAQIYQCLEPTCKGQFSATNGSIFHDSHLPLHKWFMAIALIVDAKKGISAKQIQKHLGIGSYKTAWYVCHRVRKAMVDANPAPMAGTVEIDETYIGGTAIRRFQKTPKVKAPKEMVFAIRERSTKGTVGRVRFFHVPNGKRATLAPIIKENIAPWVKRINTDQSAVYDFAIHESFNARHRTVNHSQQWVVPGSKIHTNTVESSFSLLKRGLIGSFHRVSIKHLHRYLTEFEYRFNLRKDADIFEKDRADNRTYADEGTDGIGRLKGHMQNLTDLLQERLEGIERTDSGVAKEEQRHLDQGSSERVYWHYGYASALKDVIHILQGTGKLAN